MGPFPPQSLAGLHINRFGAIATKKVSTWKVAHDYRSISFPEGAGVNQAIDPVLCSLSYITDDEVATAAMQLGRGALLAKTDIKSAYRLIPVHPSDRMLLGMQWKGTVYVNGMLPFGLRSVPKIFNAVADALEWCVAKKGVDYIFHYLPSDGPSIIKYHPGESPTIRKSMQVLGPTSS